MGPFKGTVVYNYISSIHHSGFLWEPTPPAPSSVMSSKFSQPRQGVISVISLFPEGEWTLWQTFISESKSRGRQLLVQKLQTEMGWDRQPLLNDAGWQQSNRKSEIIWFLSSWLAGLMIYCLIFCGRSMMISCKGNKRSSGSFISER